MNNETQIEREKRLQKEAKKELKRRLRRRRARAAGLNPSLLPKVIHTAGGAARNKGFFFSLPSRVLQRVPAVVALTTRRLVGALRGRGGTGGEGSKRVAVENKRRGRSKSPLSTRKRAAEASPVPLEERAGGLNSTSTIKGGRPLTSDRSASRSLGAPTSGKNISSVLSGLGGLESSRKETVSRPPGEPMSGTVQSRALPGGTVGESRRAFILRPTEELGRRKPKAGMGRGSIQGWKKTKS